MLLEIHSHACDNSGDEHLSLNGVTKIRTSSSVFIDVKVHLVLTT